jgi:hypothetical protein
MVKRREKPGRFKPTIVRPIALFSGCQVGFGLKSAALFAIAGYQNRHIKNKEDEAATH